LLPAVIVCARLIKRAIYTNVKIVPAKRALSLSADKELCGDFLLTLMAYFHGLKDKGNA